MFVVPLVRYSWANIDYSAFYIGGIMMYKFGLEFFNGSITTLATDRFKASNAFTKRESNVVAKA